MDPRRIMKQWRDIRLTDAEAALRENLGALDPEAHKAAHNLSVALLGMCSELRNIRSDIDLLNAKVGPILRDLSDDRDDVRRATRRA